MQVREKGVVIQVSPCIIVVKWSSLLLHVLSYLTMCEEDGELKGLRWARNLEIVIEVERDED